MGGSEGKNAVVDRTDKPHYTEASSLYVPEATEERRGRLRVVQLGIEEQGGHICACCCRYI